MESTSSIDPNQFIVFVKKITGQIIQCPIDPNATIAELKAMVNKAEGTPVNAINLVFVGKQLEDNKKISEYKIENQNTVHMVIKLRGGF